MSTCIDKLPHSCGTRLGLRVFQQEDGTVDGYCFACNKVVENPYGVAGVAPKRPIKVKTKEEIEEELEEIRALPTLTVPQRKLRKENLEKYGVRVGVSEEDGVTPQTMYFPATKNGVVTGFKVKTVGLPQNRTWTVGDYREVDLFGWEQAKQSDTNMLIISEGEADCIAIDRIFEMHGKEEWHPAVVSLPYGAGQAKKAIQKHLDLIRRKFKKVVLAFDNDEPGNKAAKDVLLILPEAKQALLPFKDANDCLMKGAAKAAYKALNWEAQKPKTSSLIYTEDVHEKAKGQTPYGELTWPFPYMNAKLRGVRYGETIYVGAG